jgi:hypothetical protein
LRCNLPKARASRSPARRLASPRRAQGRVPEAGDLLQPERGSGRDRRLTGSLQSREASFIFVLPGARTYHSGGRHTTSTHTRNHAVGPQCARSRIPVRSILIAPSLGGRVATRTLVRGAPETVTSLL